MDFTYTIQGGDGQTYGPASLSDVQNWIQEGRIESESLLLRSDQSDWLPARQFTELQFDPAGMPPPNPPAAADPGTAVVPTAPAPVGTMEATPLLAQVKSGASWFYWIAGLSLVNSVAALTGSGMGFVIGLGVTQIIDAVAQEIGGAGVPVAILLDLMAAGIFVMFGVFAHKLQSWAFVVGMILYALDGLLFVLVADWLSAGFHGFALIFMFKGFRALRAYHTRSIQPG